MRAVPLPNGIFILFQISTKESITWYSFWKIFGFPPKFRRNTVVGFRIVYLPKLCARTFCTLCLRTTHHQYRIGRHWKQLAPLFLFRIFVSKFFISLSSDFKIYAFIGRKIFPIPFLVYVTNIGWELEGPEL